MTLGVFHNCMILKALYLFLIYVFIHRILVEYGILPNAAKWLVELTSIAVVPVIFLYYAITKKFMARPGYFIAIFMLFLVAFTGSVVNQSSAAALIMGFRHHFKYLPFFILPMVCLFSEKEIKNILLLLGGLLLLQLPVTLFQRFVMFSSVTTGDVVGGTIASSGVVSVLMVSAISLLYSLYLSKQITTKKMLVVAFCFFIPTTINETKATFILLPLGLLLATILYGDKNMLLKMKKLALYGLLSVLFVSAFIYMYDILYGSKFERSFFDYLVQEKEGRGYLYYGDKRTQERIEEGKRIGRVDAVVTALKKTSDDFGHLMLGVGIGNALTTRISFLKTGDSELRQYFPDLTTIPNIIWELGVLGLMLHFALFFMLFKDALALRSMSGFFGAFGLGWACVIGIMAVTLFYVNVLYSDALNTTFWLISGMVVSKRRQTQKAELAQAD